jgi:glucose/arabinose dehydrogenase
MKRIHRPAGAGIILFAGTVAAFAIILAVLPAAAQSGPSAQKQSAPTDGLGVSFQDFASGFNEPVDIAFTGLVTDTRMFVVERAGVIWIVQSNGTVNPTPFLDISSTVESQDYGEEGLLGLAFEPDYASTGRFYVYYTTRLNPDDGNAGDILNIARYHVSTNPDIAALSETKVLTIPHPDNLNHNGGDLHFGPDGYLYAAPGDGGSSGDPPDNAQHKNVLLGKMLRLNVTGVPTYTIPADNPFTQTIGARPEIWAYGLRNPFRFSFDRYTGELYIADVGQDSYEEVDYQPPEAGGRNYGWHCYEGFHDFNPGDCAGVHGLIQPVAEYAHSGPNPDQIGNVIIGGYVYRGTQYPSLQGLYFYADNGDGNVWAMQTCSWQVTALGSLLNAPSSFGQDPSGQIYVATLGDGMIHKLVGPTLSAPLAPASLPHHLFLPLVEQVAQCS